MTRRELMVAQQTPSPGPRSLSDLDETTNVWTEHVEFGATAHRTRDRQTAVCGAPVLEWPIAAGHLLVLSGTLCGAGCWGGETR